MHPVRPNVRETEARDSTEPTPAKGAPDTGFTLPATGTPFRNLDGSAFLAGGGNPAPEYDVMAAANAQMAKMKMQGAQHGIPEEVTELLAREGNTMELIMLSWHQARLAAELYLHTKQRQDLSHSPLAMRMADHLVKSSPNQPAGQPAGQSEVTQVHAPAEEAGSS